ncbi:putative dehydrogenase-related protein [Archaeoglobus sulfaticallidus PM70-1]|uniref:Putative dehydrogenase-related protein n=1 Tax=Archaeoglobus sulfaticallidus PM70-1 TaxID=387631 RepID=N0B8Z0_9EURY|nr:Gfo/Idh/MocA family oxidoreductase [Archaeoglobus sulfaticallidus]AGK60084.1 putative dehydrogenase-related protein [Archaeoglobus sulfaticallidus PM70-1]
MRGLENIRVGVIGVGVMGKNHVRVYKELGCELVGIADVDKERVEEVSRLYGTRAFMSYKELLNSRIDAVSIAVPTTFHGKVALDAINAGVNVLVEKPIADSVKSALEIIEAAKKRSVKLMVGHVERFNPVVEVIKERIAHADVISISTVRVGPLPPRIKDVGVVLDLATHDIDLARYLTESEPVEIYSFISSSLYNKEDTALIMLKMENGVLVNINVNWLTPFKVREISIATADKFIRGWLIEQKVREYVRHGDDSYIVKELKVPYDEPLKLELSAFVESIIKDKPVPVSGEDGLKVLEVAELCMM